MATPAAAWRDPQFPTQAQVLDAAYINDLSESIIFEAARRSITLTKPPLRFLRDGDDLWTATPLLAQPQPFGFRKLSVADDAPSDWTTITNTLPLVSSTVVPAPADLRPFTANGNLWRIMRAGDSASSGVFEAQRIVPKPTVTGNTPVSICVEFSNTVAYPIRFRVRGREAGGTFIALTSREFTEATPTGERQMFVAEGLTVRQSIEDIVIEVRVGDGTSRTGAPLLYVYDYGVVFGDNLRTPGRQAETLDGAGQWGRLLTSARELAVGQTPPAGNRRYNRDPWFAREDYRDRYIRVSGVDYEGTAQPLDPDSYEAVYWIVEKLRDQHSGLVPGGDYHWPAGARSTVSLGLSHLTDAHSPDWDPVVLVPAGADSQQRRAYLYHYGGSGNPSFTTEQDGSTPSALRAHRTVGTGSATIIDAVYIDAPNLNDTQRAEWLSGIQGVDQIAINGTAATVLDYGFVWEGPDRGIIITFGRASEVPSAWTATDYTLDITLDESG